MGLDQYAYKIMNYIPESSTGFEDDFHAKKYDELFYWRKNYELQTWMSYLYTAKGGKGEFNCRVLLLTMEDIKNLEQWLLDSIDDDDDSTFEFCKLAIEAIHQGYTIIYDSWW
jgi:hypothetical protein